MNKFILFFLFSCTQTIERNQLINSVQSLEKAEYVVLNRPEYPDDYHQIQYIGNWVHMNNLQPDSTIQTGSYANTNQDTARYGFWGYGVQIRTELSGTHEAYKIFIDGNFIQSVNVKNPVNTANNLTYSFMGLKPLKPNDHNHILELVPDGGYFVLNTLTIHYYVDPTPDVPCDSTAINYIDSIRWNIKDSINWVDSVSYIESIRWVDSILWLVKDSTVIHYDTLFLKPKIYIKADEIIFELN